MSDFSFNELRSLIRESLEEKFPILAEKGEVPGLESKTTEKKIYIPKFRISEQWGTPGSDDRKIIEMFTKKIKGSTLSEKISSINSFVAECDAACAQAKTVDEILANLVFLVLTKVCLKQLYSFGIGLSCYMCNFHLDNLQ